MPDRFSDAELETTLRDLGERLAYPSTASLASRVRARITERREPRRPWIFALAPALVTLLVLAAGAYATDVVRLRGIDIFRGPLPTARATGEPRLPGATRVGSIADATAAAGFTPSVPDELGRPDEIYVVRPPGGSPQIALVYLRHEGIPVSDRIGAAVLLTEVRAGLEAPLLGKTIGPGTRLEDVRVGDAAGVWIEGAPHVVFYRDPSGTIVQDTLRLAGNVLLWERDGLLLRLEAQVSRDDALRLARSTR